MNGLSPPTNIFTGRRHEKLAVGYPYSYCRIRKNCEFADINLDAIRRMSHVPPLMVCGLLGVMVHFFLIHLSQRCKGTRHTSPPLTTLRVRFVIRLVVSIPQFLKNHDCRLSRAVGCMQSSETQIGSFKLNNECLHV